MMHVLTGYLALMLALLPLMLPAQTRIAVISDLNGPYGSTDYDWHVDSTLAAIIREKPDLVLCAGDMIAGQDARLPDERFAAMWDEFNRRVAAPLFEAGIPFGFTMGNHDGSPYDRFTRERRAAREFWGNPGDKTRITMADSGDFPFYFSYSQGDVFILSWDASSESITPENRDWMARQLQSPAAERAKSRILLGHLPLYAAAEGRNKKGEVLLEPDSLLQLMVDYRISIYISGHHHAYFPGKRKSVELFQTGALGGGPRPYVGSNESPRKTWTMLTLHPEAGTVTYMTYDADTGERIREEQLPPFIRGINGFTIRRDLEAGNEWLADAGDSGFVQMQRKGAEYLLKGKLNRHDHTVHFERVYLATDAGRNGIIQELARGADGEIDDVLESARIDRDMLAAGMLRILFTNESPENDRLVNLKETSVKP